MSNLIPNYWNYTNVLAQMYRDGEITSDATQVTMAAAGGVDELLYTPAANRAAAKSGLTKTNTPQMAAAAGAADKIMLSAGTDKTVKASTTAIADLATSAQGAKADTALQPVALVTATATTDAVTCNGDECLVTTKAFTTAAGGIETLVITNSSLVAGKAPQVTVWHGTCTKFVVAFPMSYDTSAHTITMAFQNGEDSDALDGNMLVLISLRGVAA